MQGWFAFAVILISRYFTSAFSGSAAGAGIAFLLP